MVWTLGQHVPWPQSQGEWGGRKIRAGGSGGAPWEAHSEMGFIHQGESGVPAVKGSDGKQTEQRGTQGQFLPPPCAASKLKDP